MDSLPHKKLIAVLTQKMFLNDLEHMTEQVNTTLLEVFHSRKIRYLPKSIFYRLEKMIAGCQIAALDHNHSVNLDQVTSSFN